ncbi:uncharacterized protein LOC144451910 isoform X2 [Glandiceps talaboti]
MEEPTARETVILSHNNYCGMECSLTIQRLPNVLSIICLQRIILLGFDRQDRMTEWENRIRAGLGYAADHKFTLSIPNRGKLPPGPATLYFSYDHFAITTSVPLKLLGAWQLKDVLKFGHIDEGFAFEANKSCISNCGIFVLLTDRGESIQNVFDSVTKKECSTVNTIRQSFESDTTNLENKPLLAYTNKCVISVESTTTDVFEQQELTKRDIIHSERTSVISTKSTDEASSKRRSDQTVDIKDVFSDRKSGSDYCDSRRTSQDETRSRLMGEEYELKQVRKLSVPSNCVSSYTSPKERFSGGHLEDYGVVSEIHKTADYISVTRKMQNMNINDVIPSANFRTAVTSKDHQDAFRTASDPCQRNFKPGGNYLENLKNSNNVVSSVRNTNNRNNSSSVSTAIRDEEYELMAPLAQRHQQQHFNSNQKTENVHSAQTDTLIREVEYELMAPQKFNNSNRTSSHLPNQGNAMSPTHHQHLQGKNTASWGNQTNQLHVSNPNSRAHIQDIDYQLMGPAAAKQSQLEPTSLPIREIDYELMLPLSKRHNTNVTQTGLPKTDPPNPYRNLPSNSKIIQARDLGFQARNVVSQTHHSQHNTETITNSGPIRETDYEIMSPGKSRPTSPQIQLNENTQPNYRVPRSTNNFVDFRRHMYNDYNSPRDNKDIFTVIEFPGSQSYHNQQVQPLLPNRTDSSVIPRPRPVSCKLLDESIPRPLPVTCKLHIEKKKEETKVDVVPVPFEHSQLVLPKTKRVELPSSPKSEDSNGSSNTNTLTRGESSRSSKKSFLSHKRKRCTTEPSRAGSPNTMENISSEAEVLDPKDNNKKNGDNKGGYQRKRSLTDPESVKHRDKSKTKGSLRKSKKKGNGDKGSDKSASEQNQALNAKDKESSSTSDESSCKSSGFKGFKKVRRGSAARDKVPIGSLRLPRKYSLSETSESYGMVGIGFPRSPMHVSRFEKRAQSFLDWPINDARRQQYRQGRAATFQRPRTGSEYEIVHRNSESPNSEGNSNSEELLGAVGGIGVPKADDNTSGLQLTSLPTLAERQSQSSIGSLDNLEQVLSSISPGVQQDTPDRKSQASSTGDALEQVLLGTDSLVEQCTSGSTQERRRKISHSRTLSMPDCSASPWSVHESAVLLQDPNSATIDNHPNGKTIEMNTINSKNGVRVNHIKDNADDDDDDDVSYAEIDFQATQNMAKKN